ncbi:MAG: GHKL domain-containing protein [Clostridia bacterium]|nr:GHKL domain-containing protein [Clostridia bacterium]
MGSVVSLIGQSAALYAALAALSALLQFFTGVVAATALFHLPVRRRWLPGVLACVLLAAAGAWRPFAVAASAGQVEVWNVVNALLPFGCMFLLYPAKAIRKACLVMLGVFGLTELIKYVALFLFFNYDNDHVNDPLELLWELLAGAALLLLALPLLLRYAHRRGHPLAVRHRGVILYLLVAVTLVIFLVSLGLLSAEYTAEKRAQFLFTLLNIPAFAATVTYAVWDLSKARMQEQIYRVQLSQQIRHYEMMEQMNEDLRVFRHDLPKKLRPLAQYLETGQSEQAKEIITQLTGFAAESGDRYNTGNARLDTVLFCQQQIAKKENINIRLAYGSVFPRSGIDPDDIYTIFPNALDNAIEACRKVGGPCEITVTSRIVGGEVLVTIENPVAGSLTVDSAGRLQTDKADKKQHGYGIRSMKKAAAKYGDDNLDYLVRDGKFILRFNLKYSS